MRNEYIDLDHVPSRDDVIAEFYLEPNKTSFEKACNDLTGESSIGTWTEVSTMKARIWRDLRPTVFSINKKEKIARISYPLALFEPGNVPQLMSSIAGNVFGMKTLENLRLLDIRLPERYIKSFSGPKFGIPGIRQKLRVKRRPLLGTIVKPKLGLSESEHAKSAFESWVGGLDIVKDDENLTSMGFNRFEKRVVETLKMRDRAEEETGEGKFYMPNITAETSEMLRRMKFVKDHGCEYAMVDIVSIGWSGLQTVRNYNNEMNLILHAHRAGHAAFTKSNKHGISMLVIAKLARLIGVDQIHVGTANVGKMSGDETSEIEDEIESKFVTELRSGHSLEQFWYNVKPVFAVASGGLYPGSLPKLLKIMGNNVIIQAGGGVHGHPWGSEAGAKAMRQALEAYMKGVSLDEYSLKNEELAIAIKKWGVKR
ncbi:MAG: type III ribulose-bisphosphate carboxylase [Candidatus Aenigmarchaeota archaeon]|nr:type III ribulose-bisphosphate carboxylase [Candidatus Aenigmarchaeota archaeon]